VLTRQSAGSKLTASVRREASPHNPCLSTTGTSHPGTWVECAWNGETGHGPEGCNPSVAEKALEEIEHFSICDMFSNGLQDNLVRQVIEEALDIRIQNDFIALGIVWWPPPWSNAGITPSKKHSGSRTITSADSLSRIDR
jgi:hypothetical protein